MNHLENFNSLLSLFIVLATIFGLAKGYSRFRGRQLGPLDLVIFLPLAAAADVATYHLFQGIQGPHADSAAYGALAGFIVLIGLVPLALLLNLIAGITIIKCLAHHPATRLPLAICLAIPFALHAWHKNEAAMQEPGGTLNNDRLAGEAWAMEAGPRDHADCDRQSSSRTFRHGCYQIVDRYPIGTPRP